MKPSAAVSIPIGGASPTHDAGEPRNPVRTYEDEDRTAVLTLYGRVFGEEARRRFERRWHWQFFGNPASQTHPPRMWVAEGPDGIVGFLASFPQRIKLGPRVAVVYHDCDLMVAAHARGHGIGRRLVQAYDSLPNPLSSCLAYAPRNGRIRQRSGYRAALLAPRYVRPYDLGAIVRFKLSEKVTPGGRLSRLASVASALAGGLNGPLWLINRWRRPRSPAAITTEDVAEVDTSFDRLWAELSPSFPVIAVRDRRFVHWRFAADPLHRHTMVGTWDTSGRLRGYAALRHTSSRDLRRTYLMDLFAAPDDRETVEALFAASIDRSEAAGTDCVYGLGLNPRLRELARRYLYAPLPSGRRPSWLLWKGDEELHDLVYDEGSWHVTLADSDIGVGL